MLLHPPAAAGGNPPAAPPRRASGAAACRRRAAIAKDGPPALPFSSLYEMFQASVSKYADNPCLGVREGAGYTWLTYKQTAEQVDAVGAALVQAGLAPHGRVGVYGANSPQWMVAMQVGGAGRGRCP